MPGNPKVWSIGWSKLIFWSAQLKKKNVLFRTMGPLNCAPYWFILMTDLAFPSALAKNSFELRDVLRRNSYKVPWKAFCPLRVATFTFAPLLRPSSAVGLLVVTLYS